MRYSYFGLEKRLAERGLTKTDLCSLAGVSSRTVAKIGKGEKIADRVLAKIAACLSCPVSELWTPGADDPVLNALREEKAARISGGLYHELQVRMTYNSNHMEGSRLSEQQTRMIFETSTVMPDGSGGGVPVDDIIETVNHFRAIDYVIDTAEEELTEESIKTLHRLLKQNTKDDSFPWFAVGDYKKRPNTVGGKETAKPKDVPAKMKALLEAYRAAGPASAEDIISFHHDFETIHPFQDGNGRVGRLIMLKECLRLGIVPFLIEDTKKAFYYRGLAEWDREKGYLIDTCLDGQDTFRKLLALFDIEPE